MPFGAEVLAGGGVRYRLWAPAAREVHLKVKSRSIPMESRPDGWFEISDRESGPGTRYQYRIDGKLLVPDPASRFQPKDADGPS